MTASSAAPGTAATLPDDRYDANIHPYPAPASLREQVMMPYHAYQVAQAERPQTEAVRRAADVRLGEMAAALAQLAAMLRRPPLRLNDPASSRRRRAE